MHPELPLTNIHHHSLEEDGASQDLIYGVGVVVGPTLPLINGLVVVYPVPGVTGMVTVFPTHDKHLEPEEELRLAEYYSDVPDEYQATVVKLGRRTTLAERCVQEVDPIFWEALDLGNDEEYDPDYGNEVTLLLPPIHPLLAVLN